MFTVAKWITNRVKKHKTNVSYLVTFFGLLSSEQGYNITEEKQLCTRAEYKETSSIGAPFSGYLIGWHYVSSSLHCYDLCFRHELCKAVNLKKMTAFKGLVCELLTSASEIAGSKKVSGKYVNFHQFKKVYQLHLTLS